MSTTNPQPASYNLWVYPGDKGPLLKELFALCNRINEARRGGDTAAVARHSAEFDTVFARFMTDECPRAELPPWREQTMRAAKNAALGNWELALADDTRAWEATAAAPPEFPEDRLKLLRGTSAANRADELRRLGRHEDAVLWGKLACDLWPDNTGFAFVYALCLAKLGARDAASALFETLLPQRPDDRPTVAHLIAPFEDELHDADVSTLPAVAAYLNEE